MTAQRCVRSVTGQLDELELVRSLEFAGEVGEEDDARLERRDQERLGRFVVVIDLVSKLGDALGYLLGGEIAVADSRIVG